MQNEYTSNDTQSFSLELLTLPFLEEDEEDASRGPEIKVISFV